MQFLSTVYAIVFLKISCGNQVRLVCSVNIQQSVNAPLCRFLFQVLDANTCFEKQPPSALSLQLAAYYYSLQIYSRLAPCFKDKCSPLYRVSVHLHFSLCHPPFHSLSSLSGTLASFQTLTRVKNRIHQRYNKSSHLETDR